MLTPLRSALDAWAPGVPGQVDPLAELIAAWPRIVGDDVAAHSRPLELARDALVVATRSSAWSQQLSFLNERVLTAVAEHGMFQVRRVRFRVARLSSGAPRSARPAGGERRRRRAPERPPAQNLDEAIARFRADVTGAQRAKAAAGWKECAGCAVRVPPDAAALCVPCSNREQERKARAVARLLYELPWLGYAGTAELIDGLRPQEYEAIRKRLLSRWWEILVRLRRSGRTAVTTHERSIASSYLLLKSGLLPDAIAPAVVRDLLGDELHEILYGTENY